MAVRLFLLQTHYRQAIVFGREGLANADKALTRLGLALDGYSPVLSVTTTPEYAREARSAFEQAMDDDFNTPGALGALFDLAREINRRRPAAPEAADVVAGQAMLAELTGVLGLPLESGTLERDGGDAAPYIELLLATRQRLREAKQWALADEIRDGLRRLGIAVEDRPTGAVWRRESR